MELELFLNAPKEVLGELPGRLTARALGKDEARVFWAHRLSQGPSMQSRALLSSGSMERPQEARAVRPLTGGPVPRPCCHKGSMWGPWGEVRA